ncbi:unnamed protein product [Closterium sp. NIES-54]
MAAAKRVLRYLCSTSGMGLVLGGQSPVVLTGHADASWADDQATQRSTQGYTFSLGSGSVSWRATRSSSVLGSSCEAEIYAGAMAAQELRWLTYLLTDLGEPPRSPPVLYVDNKAMLALCREQRLEHRTKHIALRYFLARELQQRGQLRLAYVASEANTADVFTKALAPCDHQRLCTQLVGGVSSMKVGVVEELAIGAVSVAVVADVVSAATMLFLLAGLLLMPVFFLLHVWPAAAIVTMVDPVVNAGGADTLEARLADARKRHADGEYGTIPMLIVELGIRSQWVTEHPSRPDSPRPVRNEGGVDDEVYGSARVSGNYGTKQRGVIKVDGGVDRSQAQVQQSTAAPGSSHTDIDGRRRSPLRSGGGLSTTTHVTPGGIAPTYGYFKFSPDRITVAPLQGRWDLITRRESIEPQLEVAGLKGFADGTVPIPPMDNIGLRGEFRAAHLLTFMVISRCCSPAVQLALRSCRERLDAGHQAWHFILSTYQVRDDLYIAQLEEKMTHIRMGEQESATDYCNRARRILAEMRMAGVEYSTASYISHLVKGLPRGYNLMKRMMMVPGTREPLDEDSITSYILQDEAMQEAEQPTDLLPQANYAAPTKPNQQPGQRRMHGGGGSGGGRSTKDVDEKRSTRGKGHGGDGRRRECWICHDPDHLSYECPDRDDNDEDDTKGGRGRSISSRLRRNEMPRREKLTSKKTSKKTSTTPAARAEATGRRRARWSACVDTIKSSAKHDVATGLDITPSTGPDSPFVAKDGSLYFLLLKDRHARFVWVMPVAKKSDVLREFQKWLVLVERQKKTSVLMLRSDRGGEFLGKEFTDFVDGKGIVHDLTCPCTPQQNGMAEREMRTIVKTVRTMLLHMGVQHHWWHLTLRQAVWVRNCLERSTTPPGTTPYQLLTGKKPDLTLARVWGCMVQFMVPEQQRGGKLAPKACWGLHLGVSPESKGCEVLDLTDNKVVTSVEVIFYETLSLETTGELPKSAGGEQQLVEGSKQLVDDLTVDEEGERSAGEDSTDSDVVEVPISKPELRRTDRVRRPPERPSFHTCLQPAAFTAVYDEFDDDLLYDNAEEDDELPELDPDMHTDPEHRWDIATMTIKEALASWKGEAVKAAMEEEIRSLVSMGTWELVERPRGVNIMKNRWVLTTKYRLDDTVEREKARLVVKGFTQVCGAGYDETFLPVSSYVTLRIFLSIVAVFDLNLMQLDMKNAFLQSKLDRVLYMYQPDYFDDGTSRVCKLLKSLYGLKQSPLLWYRALDRVLLGASWKKVDEALYFKAGDNGVTCWVLVYVNDLLAASSSPAMLKELKELLEAAFELREISPVVKYIGLEIVRDRPAGKLWLHQQGYADKLRRRFIDEEQGGRVPKTPVSVDAYAKLTFNDEEAQERKEEEYQLKVGSVQLAATTTRPDIAFACSKLGSGLTVRSDQHWCEVDRCLAYLADTRDTALEFGGGQESLELIGYVDADDAGDKQNRTSTSSYVFVYGGAAVSWSSSRIKCATSSSTESEYIAATNASKEGLRLRFLLAEFKLLDAGKPTILRVDNKSAITVAEGLGLTGNLKHMERRYAWLQHMVRRGKFVLKYIPTTEQPADFLTKALHFPAFNRCSVAIGQVRLVDVGDGDDDVQQ